jgi:hypothetical protein
MTATTARRRIQRRREAGWRMPEDAVYVGRPSAFGNPYWMPGAAAGRHDGVVFDLFSPGPKITVESRRESVLAYRLKFVAFIDDLDDWLAPLRGKRLACWCPLDQPCHADVLIELLEARGW